MESKQGEKKARERERETDIAKVMHSYDTKENLKLKLITHRKKGYITKRY